MTPGRDFTSLEVYRLAEDLIVEVYAVTRNFPKEELYGITSQIRRAVVSISLNIAESYGRFHFKDKNQFLFNARGSLLETKSLVLISERLGMLSGEEKDRLIGVINRLGVKLNNFISYLKVKHS